MKQSRTSRSGRIERVLVVRKTTYLEKISAAKDRRMLGLLAENHPSVAHVQTSHDQHMQTVTAVVNALNARVPTVRFIKRNQLEGLAHRSWDLSVTIGGDGTLLDCSHYLPSTVPVLGVNSAPGSSHGHYCVANADNFPAVLDELLTGKRKPVAIRRLQLALDRTPIKELVLNEVLVAHPTIGETSRYLVSSHGIEEEHKSDGIFVGTPGGCTGWMRSYGGQIVPLTADVFPFIVRGLIRQNRRHYRLAKGLMSSDPDASIRIVSLMEGGTILIDGPHISYPFPRGSELLIKPSRRHLQLVIDAEVTDSRYK